MSGQEATAALREAWDSERTAVLASVARRLGDLQAAEDAVQEAFAAAAEHWPRTGVPERPGAWLTTTAWRKALDALRRTSRTTREGDLALPERAALDPRLQDEPEDPRLQDDVLALVLTCCHPSLAPEAQVALTLRHVVGLTTAQIAARLLVSEPTMTKRLVRARTKIRDAAISFTVPAASELYPRLDPVHAVVYLLFTEGYLAAGPGPSVRQELCTEAVWLARQLHAMLPDDHETTGLLALLLLQQARAGARVDVRGGLVAYEDQDRELWDDAAIGEAGLLLGATVSSPPGPYRLEAAIALLHARAVDAASVAWPEIAALYDALARQAPSPVVEINRAVAHGRAYGPEKGLLLLQKVRHDPKVSGYLPLHVAHADLVERAGRGAAAAAAWRTAAGLASDAHQRRQLEERAVVAEVGWEPPVR